MKAVILGWKRVHLKKYLDDCEKICSQLTKDGYDIYTGGGTGFMEYANCRKSLSSIYKLLHTS